ncbi:MAG: hypothetical protein V8S95_06540 [Odoribacter sp.]
MTTRNKFIILWILGLILGVCACSSDNGIEDTPGTGQEENRVEVKEINLLKGMVKDKILLKYRRNIASVMLQIMKSI